MCARIQAGKVREQFAAGKVREHLPAGTVRVQWGDCNMRCIALALACAFCCRCKDLPVKYAKDGRVCSQLFKVVGHYKGQL